MKQTIHKAIVAVLGGAVTIASLFVPGVDTIADPEMIASVATIITAGLVWLIPNKPKE